MESNKGFFPSMEVMDTSTFNNQPLIMDFMDDQFIDELLDTKPCPSLAFSPSIASCTSSMNIRQVKQPNSSDLSPLNHPSAALLTSQKASPTFSSPQLISFGNPTSTTDESYTSYGNWRYRNPVFNISPDGKSYEPKTFSLTTTTTDVQNNFHSLEDDDLGYSRRSPFKRTPQQALHHVLAERKRRKKLSKRFVSLSKVVPGLRKPDKATILEDATKYIKGLQERVKILEEELMKSPETSHDDDGADQGCITTRSSNDDDSTIEFEEEDMPEIKVKISEKNVLIKILCEKKYQGCVLDMVEELKKLHLTILSTRVLQFGGCAIDITFGGQMESQFSTTVNGIIKHLQIAIFQPTSLSIISQD